MTATPVVHVQGAGVVAGDAIKAASPEWSFDAPQLTVVVSDRGGRLMGSLKRGKRLQDQVSCTYAGVRWRATAVEDGPSPKFTFDHWIVDELRLRKGPVSASKGMDRPQFNKSLLTLRGAASYRVVCPEAKGEKPPRLDARVASQLKRQQEERDTQRAPGFADKASFKVAGRTASSEQKKVLAQALSVADDEQATGKARLALVAAIIVESRARNLSYGDASSTGALQVLASTAKNLGVDARDVAAVSRVFLRDGFWRRRPDGAIALARKYPSWSLGKIAQETQGSAHPERYDGAAAEARAIVAAWGDGTGSKTSFVPGKRTYQVGDDEDFWAYTGKSATEVRRQRFIAGNVVYWVAETLLTRSRPYAVLSPRSDAVRLKPGELDELLQVEKCSAELLLPAVAAGDVIGRQVQVVDAGPANGTWLVVKAGRPGMGGRWVPVELERPRNPLAEPPPPAKPTGSARERGPVAATRVSSAARLTTSGGAKGIVDQVARICRDAGGASIYVGSSLRPGSTTSSGNASDHGSNNEIQAARDIGKRGTNLLTGPPSKEMDRAVAAVGKAFGRDYGNGARKIIDTFTWNGYRIQLIWRTPLYGGHMGHLHAGARKL